MVTRKQRLEKTVAVTRTTSSRMQAWMAGELKAEDLTDEEVYRMRLMDSDGHFRGKPSLMVPRELAQAFRNEAQKRLQTWFVEQIPAAQEAYLSIMKAQFLAPGDAAKLRAAEGIFERVIGKVTNTVDMHAVVEKKDFEDVLEEVLVEIEEEDDE